MQKFVIFVKKNFKIKKLKKNNIVKPGTVAIILGNIKVLHIKYSIPKEIPILFHNGSNYDDHIIIKELAEEFEKQFTCLGQNTKKYITFQLLCRRNHKNRILHIATY